jgi:hypothetical protein
MGEEDHIFLENGSRIFFEEGLDLTQITSDKTK